MAAYVDDLLDFPGYPGIPERAPDHSRIAGFFRATRRRGFDLALQMYGGQPAANEVTERMGARRTGGFFTPWQWPADPASHLPYPGHAHEVDRHLQLMAFLGAPSTDRHLEFPIHTRERTEARRIRAWSSRTDSPYVVLHPGATAPSRRWPPERFAAVGDALVRRGFEVLVTGVPTEMTLCQRLCAAMRRPVANLCGRTNLGVFAALVAAAAALVTNDSGPTQIAAACGTPSLTVYLAGDPARWRPDDHFRHRALVAGFNCQPCSHQVCPIDHRCATAIEPGHVVAEIDDLLSVMARHAG
jgi:ADP-heptose:LPS heptosyltransferase